MTETQPHLRNAFSYITVIAYERLWHLKSPSTRPVCFNRSFRVTMKYIKSLSLALCEGNAPVTSGLPSQRDSNVECISISSRNHAFLKNVRHYILFSINLMQIVWHFPTWADIWDSLAFFINMDTVRQHWGRVMHIICVSKQIIIGSDNGLSSGRRQAIIWTNAGILLIWTIRTNFSEILSEIRTFSLKKMHLKVSSGNWRPFCLSLNVLIMSPVHQQEIPATNSQGPVSIWRPSFPGMGFPMLKIRWSQDHLIFNMEIAILVRRHIYIKTPPSYQPNLTA